MLRALFQITTRLAFVMALALAVLLSATALRAAEPVAVLMSVSGPVNVAQGDAEESGRFGLHLEAGSTVSTGVDGSCDIIFSSGQTIHLGPGSNMTVQGQEATSVAAGQAGGGDFQAAKDFLSLKGKRGSSLIARMRSSAPEGIRVLAPIQTALRAARPTFRWAAPEGTGEIQLTVYAPDGIHWQGVCDASEGKFDYPADGAALASGVQYSWTMETTDPLQFPPLRSTAAYFSIMDAAIAGALDTQLESLAKSDLSPAGRALLRASLLYGHGATGEAIELTRKALENTGDAGLREILAQLYIESGQNAEALALMDGARTP